MRVHGGPDGLLSLCANSRQTGTKSHSNLVRAQARLPGPDALAGIAARVRFGRAGDLDRSFTSSGPSQPGAHAIAMHGEPAWPADFSHPDYANAEAPKDGQLVQGVLGTFDSLNPSS